MKRLWKNIIHTRKATSPLKGGQRRVRSPPPGAAAPAVAMEQPPAPPPLVENDDLDDIVAVENSRKIRRDEVPFDEGNHRNSKEEKEEEEEAVAETSGTKSDQVVEDVTPQPVTPPRPPRSGFLRMSSRQRSRSGSITLYDIPGSPRARTSTYTNVRETVMHHLSEAERSKHDKTVPMGVVGLRNLGNTCFINSSLQCLSATIPLTDYFLGYDYRSEINKENFLGTGGELVRTYAELTQRMWMGNRSVVEPLNFKKQLSTFAPQFSGGHQHDSQELLSFLLDGIHEDLNRVKTRPSIEDKDCDGTQDELDAIDAWKNYLKRNKSLVVDLFQGQLRNTCKCLECGHMNIRFEPFMYLSLPVNDECKSLDDCIDLYVEQETLVGTDQWYCEKCKKHVDSTKKTDLWILPPILIVHLKRFKYDDYGKAGSKNDQPISYPVSQWDLKHHVKSEKGVYPKFDLYAVSNHMGGLGSGHYKASTLNRFDELWYEFNDSEYKAMPESIHDDYAKSAYVLFYNRSEGDASAPLNERSPLIRRQSVSRPDLWPHSLLDDRDQVRNFTRSSRRFHDGASPMIHVRKAHSGSMSSLDLGACHPENGLRPRTTVPEETSDMTKSMIDHSSSQSEPNDDLPKPNDGLLVVDDGGNKEISSSHGKRPVRGKSRRLLRRRKGTF